MIRFEIVRHTVVPDRHTVEVWNDDTFVAAIYATEAPLTVSIVSKYARIDQAIAEVWQDIPKITVPLEL